MRNALGTVPARRPIALIHIDDAHHAAAGRRVDKLIAAEIDADVRVGAAHGVVEHQVTRAQIIAFDSCAKAPDFMCAARQLKADDVAV